MFFRLEAQMYNPRNLRPRKQASQIAREKSDMGITADNQGKAAYNELENRITISKRIIVKNLLNTWFLKTKLACICDITEFVCVLAT